MVNFHETGVVVDHVWYSPARLREIVRERERLAEEVWCWDFAYDLLEQRRLDDVEHLTQELALANDTLTRRSAALNRLASENEMLRAQNRPNP